VNSVRLSPHGSTGHLDEKSPRLVASVIAAWTHCEAGIRE
jgi:hypothetical protein